MTIEDTIGNGAVRVQWEDGKLTIDRFCDTAIILEGDEITGLKNFLDAVIAVLGKLEP